MDDQPPSDPHQPRSQRPDSEELRCWLALLRAPGVGAVTLRPLLDAQPRVTDWFRRPPPGAPDRLREYLRAPVWDLADADMAWLEQPGNRLLRITDPDYPPRLRELSDAPAALYLHGDAQLLNHPQLAIVGSRNPSPSGRDNARAFAAHLATAGLGIISGLAEGIDAAAHEGALQAEGITLAVTGTGLDRVYPARHRELAHRIATSGLLISEFPPGTPPKSSNFPRRNRIISGLSLGTLVVEAAVQSGSLITARLAMEQGREVFAIPGSIHNPLAKGCHRLIRDGAKLVETAQDILEELVSQLGMERQTKPLPEDTNISPNEPPDPEYQALLAALDTEPVSLDQLVTRTGMAVEVLSSMLLLLELEGHVSSAPGSRYFRNAASMQAPGSRA